MLQERVPVNQLQDIIEEKVSFKGPLKKLQDETHMH
jgi:hypothetical protein